MKEQIDYIRDHFIEGDRDHKRWNTHDVNDASVLLRELMELEWRYHHISLLKLRNRKYTEWHSYFGMYWATRHIITVLFPWATGGDSFSRKICELNKTIEEEDNEMLERCL